MSRFAPLTRYPVFYWCLYLDRVSHGERGTSVAIHMPVFFSRTDA